MRILFDILSYLLEWQKSITFINVYFGFDMNKREKKKLASAGKRATDLSLDNPSQHPLH